MEYKELTEEGQRMFDNIMKLQGKHANEESITITRKKKQKFTLSFNPYEIELKFLQLEIKKLIRNSELVIRDCDEIIARFKTPEEYLTHEAKVAKTLHMRLIERLNNVLAGLPAFEDETHLGVVDKEKEEQELKAPEPHYNRVQVG